MTGLTLDVLPRIGDHPRGPALDAALWKIGGFLPPAARKKLGVQLLHGHGLTRRDEGIVERNADGERQTWVVPSSEVDGLWPTIYGVVAGGVLVPLQFDVDRASTTVDPDVEALARFLDAEGLRQTFAIIVLRNRLMPGPDEVLLEITDHMARRQRSAPVPRSTVPERLIASWRFGEEGQPIGLDGCPGNDEDHGGSGGG